MGCSGVLLVSGARALIVAQREVIKPQVSSGDCSGVLPMSSSGTPEKVTLLLGVLVRDPRVGEVGRDNEASPILGTLKYS